MKRTSPGLACFSLFALLALQPLGAFAATYVPMTDAALVDQTPAIVLARVLSSEAAPAEGSTLTTVAVSRVLKGASLPSPLVVRVPGFVGEDTALLVPGAPRFSVGERVLLFLAPRGDGTWGIQQFLLGAFHEQSHAGERFAVRDLAGAAAAGAAAADVEPARDFERFADWIAGRAAGVRAAFDYTALAPPVRSLSDDFVLLGQARWTVFAAAGDASWRFHAAGWNGSGAGQAAFAAARATWNNDANSTVAYTDGGVRNDAGTGIGPNDNPTDGDNSIIFGDPLNQISGAFSCGQGGILAIGGYYTSGQHNHAGQQFFTIAEADIVVQNGTACFFTNNPGSDADVFTHELGHTLGLGHSPDSSAIMFSSAQAPYSATLGADDRAGICYLYGTNCPGGTLPQAPSNLSAQVVSSTQVQLSWSDNSDNESSFRVEMRTGGGGFLDIGSVAANAIGANISGLSPATSYIFRVRARNTTGNSAYSNIAPATTPAGGSPPNAPSSLTATPQSTTAILLQWHDNSSDESSFVIERLSGFSFVPLSISPANTTTALLIGLSPNTSYTLRLRARNGVGDSAASNTVTATTFTGVGTPPTGPSSLQATAASTSLINLSWTDHATNEESFRIEMRTGGAAFAEVGSTGANATLVSIDGLQAGTTYDFRVRSRNGAGDSAYSNTASATTPQTCGGGDPDTVCLNSGRFATRMTWRLPDGSQGVGHPVNLSTDAAYFWFFSPSNIETVVKVLDGCGVSGSYWVFATGLTNVEVVLTVKDTVTQEVRTYTNAQGTPFAPLQDVAAFFSCNAAGGPPSDKILVAPPNSTAGSTSAAACAPGSDALCIQDGRFRVTASWQTASGATGQGSAAQLTSDSGTFWFFDPSNVELIVKVLDACAFADRFWVFAGGLTNVQVTLTVTDTESGEMRTYTNPLNQPYLPLQDGNAFDTCP